MSEFTPPWRLRQNFADRLSLMYREEVPAYGTLVDLVENINTADAEASTFSGARLGQERHGAIRLALPEELSLLRRALGVLGMFPVDYYDLAAAGLPVHSTAFRPINGDAIERSPFRLFVSLVRLNQIASPALQSEVERLTRERSVMSPVALRYIERAEHQGGLTELEGEAFLDALIETFRWRGEALSTKRIYDAFINEHPLLADIVCFPNPHINHLTPRVSDIDAAQQKMIDLGLPAKAVIEGPPRRKCPILLRQTAFRALEENVTFRNLDGVDAAGVHTARFGEIESRGAAMTRAGMALYNTCLASGDFDALPDDWDELRTRKLVWFRFRTATGARLSGSLPESSEALDDLIAKGIIIPEPITYEDFLPVSAAGIFRSNLRSEGNTKTDAKGNQAAFEEALGCRVSAAQALYEQESRASLQRLFAHDQPKELAVHE
jgi:2-oxoadipate dioxygenase/decarboxylase